MRLGGQYGGRQRSSPRGLQHHAGHSVPIVMMLQDYCPAGEDYSRLLRKCQSGNNSVISIGHNAVVIGFAIVTDDACIDATNIERRAKPPPASELVVYRFCIHMRSPRAGVVAYRPQAQRVSCIVLNPFIIQNRLQAQNLNRKAEFFNFFANIVSRFCHFCIFAPITIVYAEPFFTRSDIWNSPFR